MPKSTAMMENFKKEYALDLTFEQVESTLKSFKLLNDFLPEKTNYESKTTVYEYDESNSYTGKTVIEYEYDTSSTYPSKIIISQYDKNDQLISREER